MSLFVTTIYRLDDILSSVHKSVQTIESNTKANARIANKVSELLEAETKLSSDKHSDKQVDELDSAVFYPSCERFVHPQDDGTLGNTHLLNRAPVINHTVSKSSAGVNVY